MLEAVELGDGRQVDNVVEGEVDVFERCLISHGSWPPGYLAVISTRPGNRSFD
jgi:hypothetical protein